MPTAQPRRSARPSYDPDLAYLDTADDKSSEEDDGIVGMVFTC